jgi:hypothetical protein
LGANIVPDGKVLFVGDKVRLEIGIQKEKVHAGLPSSPSVTPTTGAPGNREVFGVGHPGGRLIKTPLFITERLFDKIVIILK